MQVLSGVPRVLPVWQRHTLGHCIGKTSAIPGWRRGKGMEGGRLQECGEALICDWSIDHEAIVAAGAEGAVGR
jgi:hypothetical protein